MQTPEPIDDAGGMSTAIAAAGGSCSTAGGSCSTAGGTTEGLCSTPPEGFDTPWGLVDMPALWLDQLVQELGPQQRLSLSKSCRTLRDLVLSLSTLRVQFWLPLQPELAAAAHDQLLACQRAPRVKLMLSADHTAPSRSLPSYINASGWELMGSQGALPAGAGMQAATDLGLPSIRSVVLTRLELDSLVPPWLTSSCPNMTSLHLNCCVICQPPQPTPPIPTQPIPTPPSPATSIPTIPIPPTASPTTASPTITPSPTCSQLKELTLDGTRQHEQHASMATQGWPDHFRALTGLHTLTIRGSPAHVFHATPIGTQLTHLTFLSEDCRVDVLQRLPASFPNLTHLHLPGTVITDEGMEHLTSLQHLTCFECKGFSLDNSHAHRPCSWTQLEFGHLDVPSFDRLPLAGVRSLRVRAGDWGRVDELIIGPGLEAEVTVRVAAVIAARGGLQHFTAQHHQLGLQRVAAAADTPSIRVYVHSGSADGVSQAASLAMAASCQPYAITLDDTSPVSLELLASIKEHLSCIRPLKFIELRASSFAPGVLPLLLPSLPPGVTTLGLYGLVNFTELQLTKMCMGACRPVSVELGYAHEGWEKGWEKRVRAAMSAAGHQHVDLIAV